MYDIFLLERVKLPTSTPGSLYWPNGDLVCKTLELPWKGNQHNVSCIPMTQSNLMPDYYEVHKMPPGFGRDYAYFRLKYVPGRNINRELGMSTILMHPITFVEDLKGCIGVGPRHVDFNADNVPDMDYGSKAKLQWMCNNLPAIFLLEIRMKGERAH